MLTGRTVLVVGMARSGIAAARLALRRGASVICTDRRPDAPRIDGTEAVYGEHRRADFLAADVIVVSPGVPASQPDVAAAIAAGRDVVGELGFAARFLACPILAVSGTNGKSTTTHLLGQLLGFAGVKAYTGGNIGNPLSDAVDGGFEVCAVEVSSYQMELPGAFRPRAAAILNLTPDHLERHGTMEAYGEHKCRMFARMGPNDLAIVPAADPRIVRLADGRPGRRLFLDGSPGVRIRDGALVFTGVHDPGELSLDGFSLPGDHNRENLACAALLAVAGGGLWRADLAVERLTGLPHRMELVGEPRGVRWIDDSKATNVDAARIGLMALPKGARVIALLGGRGKEGAPYGVLGDALRAARAVICFGEAGERIAEVLGAAGIPTTRVPWLVDAVRAAHAAARAGDTVLLSPACASFDEFNDFEHRGRAFRALVEGLPE